MKPSIAICLLALAQFVQAQTSHENPKLKRALERFPDADANKDGTLTAEEAKAYLAANPQMKRKKQADQEGEAIQEDGEKDVSEAVPKPYEPRTGIDQRPYTSSITSQPRGGAAISTERFVVEAQVRQLPRRSRLGVIPAKPRVPISISRPA